MMKSVAKIYILQNVFIQRNILLQSILVGVKPFKNNILYSKQKSVCSPAYCTQRRSNLTATAIQPKQNIIGVMMQYKHNSQIKYNKCLHDTRLRIQNSLHFSSVSLQKTTHFLGNIFHTLLMTDLQRCRLWLHCILIDWGKESVCLPLLWWIPSCCDCWKLVQNIEFLLFLRLTFKTWCLLFVFVCFSFCQSIVTVVKMLMLLPIFQ